jgi:hypothetical protein
VGGLFLGAKNGKDVGMRLSIVAIAVEAKNLISFDKMISNYIS